MRRCPQTGKLLLKKQDRVHAAAPFKAPLDWRALQLLDYPARIRQPMDLGTVQTTLEAGRYASPSAFEADVRLTFNNGLAYNVVDTPAYPIRTWASILLAEVDRLMPEIVRAHDLSAPPRAASTARSMMRKRLKYVCNNARDPTPRTHPPHSYDKRIRDAGKERRQRRRSSSLV